MRRLVIDIDEAMYEKLDILSGNIRSLRDKIVLDLIEEELEKQKYVIERLRNAELRKQDEMKLLRKHYERKGDNNGSD
jgi:metal-responsive CopG/Arc/MetJ family transcriptional regulator